MKTYPTCYLLDNNPKIYFSSFWIKCSFFLIFFFNFTFLIQAQQVTEVITDYNGFWKSGTTALNPVFPKTSHNLLAFKYNNIIYSTEVNNAKLNDSSITYTSVNFQAFPVATVGGFVISGVYIALAGNYDGVPNGYSNPLPSLKIKDVLIDGLHGLDLGTGVTNVPASALINFPVNSISGAAISDAEPDILVSQVAAPSSNGDTLYFVNSAGTLIGNKIAINWNLYNPVGSYYLDLYTLPVGALCDTAKINSTSVFNTTREIRLIALKLSEFGITTGNAPGVTQFILKASGTSDPAFIAYNAGAFTIPAPVITVQPVSQIICPNTGNSVTLGVTATGSSLTYQWRKNGADIAGATSSTYTISNVVSSSAGTYYVIINNAAGSVSSDPAYVNISIAVQPSPGTQTIATGAADTLTISAHNASSYQWKRNGVDITGATSANFMLNPVTTINAGDYTVQIINATNGGCASILSSPVTVVASKTLYSKPGVSLNLPGSWGVVTNGTGSSPVDFSRAEHTFIVKYNAATNGNLTIAGTLDVANAVVAISPNSTLDAGKIIRSGTGSLAGSGASDLTVRDSSSLYFQPGNDLLKNFTVYNGNVSLISPLSITAGSSAGTVTLKGGTLNTGGNLAFKSNIFGTASLAAITGGAIISGTATIERYIPAARGWRLLSVPIRSTGAPTINASWQEGATTASTIFNPNPGFGGQITGGTTINGFDQSATNIPSIKIFDNSINSFVRLPASPGTNAAITSYPAYFLYLRGDRGINLMQGLNAAITSATLRMKGQIKTGEQSIIINAANYTLVGNPYPSAIDFGTLIKNNVNNTMYVWDPKMAGDYGLGSYVTVSYNSATDNYDITSSISPVSQYIQSGEAFLIASADSVNPGTLTIKETDKTSGGSDLVYRPGGTGNRIVGMDQQLRVNLYSANTSDSASLLDGVLTTYDSDHSNNVDNDDAHKLSGSNESVGIKRNGKMLAIERRNTIIQNDTTFLNLYQMKIHNYKFEFIADNLNYTGTFAVIKDSYSNTINNLPLDMNGATFIPFSINSDPASYASNRFSIVFAVQVPLPVTIKSVKAYQLQQNIAVEWETENEINIKHYEIERSANGRNFIKINTTVSKAFNGGSAAYRFIDTDPLNGNNYYRIRSVEQSGKVNYSIIVKVNILVVKDVPSFLVYPNPVSGNTIFMLFNNIEKGNYAIRLFNESGQIVAFKTIQYNGNIATENLVVGEKFATGKYELKLSGEGIILNTPVIKR
jgi:hypothetical protein